MALTRTPAVKFAEVNTAAATETELVALVANAKIRVLAAVILGNGDLTFTSGTIAGTDISCDFAVASAEYCALPYCPHGWFETASGEALNLKPSANAGSAQIVYEEIF